MVRWVVVVTERAGGWQILTLTFLACLWVGQGLVWPIWLHKIHRRDDMIITFQYSVDAWLRNQWPDRLLQGRGRGSLPSEKKPDYNLIS